jgi:hypothetical protein
VLRLSAVKQFLVATSCQSSADASGDFMRI